MRAQVVGGEFGCQSKHTDNSGTVAETDDSIIVVDACDAVRRVGAAEVNRTYRGNE